MKILLDDKNYIVAYCTIGDIDGGIDCDIELPNDINDKMEFYKYVKDKEKKQFFFDEEKYLNFIEKEKLQIEYEKEVAKQEEILTKLNRNSMLMSLDDKDLYNVRFLFDDWISNVPYKKDTKVKYEKKLYKCLLDHTSQDDWTPNEAVSLWVEIIDPNMEFPEWRQPIGSHDAYMKGDKVTYEGKKYISTVDSNVWKPTEYGWDVIE